MSFIEEIKERARKDLKTIVLPEGNDIRTLEAAEIVEKEKFAKIILLGNKKEILDISKTNNINIDNITIIEPKNSENYEEFAQKLYNLRKEKGLSLEKAKELVLDPVYFGMMMVKLGKSDGLVSGAAHSTADTLRPALQILKTAPRYKTCIVLFCNVCSKYKIWRKWHFCFC